MNSDLEYELADAEVRMEILAEERDRLKNAITDMIGGYELRLNELNQKYAEYRAEDDMPGCDRISARVNEVHRLIDALRAIHSG